MLKTAEFVSPSHPDKLCDRISDSILDEYLKQDPHSRVAVETAGGHGKVFITGEITSKGHVTDDTIKDIVYSISKVEDVTVHLVQQSPEIAQGVDTGGAGDQGIMIGYACNENDEMVPQEYYLARKLNRMIYEKYPFDGKTQVRLNGDLVRVVASFQNAPKTDLEAMCLEFFNREKYTIEALHCNPAGDWSQGGFDADAGVTGRKLAVDNYGPRVPLGGGAFSGKDATKVDRSAAYIARFIAVKLLEASKAKEVLVRLAYAIGYDKPLEATAIVDGELVTIVPDQLTPNNIIDTLDLTKPIFSETAEWGHMGRNFKWK
jgi:S-adenosylmethionine synthetase